MSKSKKRAKGPKPGFVRITMDYPRDPGGNGPWLKYEPSGSCQVTDGEDYPATGQFVKIVWNREDK